ncbi:MAG: hypothetical protein ABI325_04440 [Ginsengibacter sp.]
MSTDKNNTAEDKKEKLEQHKKWVHVSAGKEKKQTSENVKKTIQKNGSKDDDWNDPTGNSHPSDES